MQALGCSRSPGALPDAVALHSGYCLRRQYLTVRRHANGKNVQRFLDRLVARHVAAGVATAPTAGTSITCSTAVSTGPWASTRPQSAAGGAGPDCAQADAPGCRPERAARGMVRDGSGQGGALHRAVRRAAGRSAARDLVAEGADPAHHALLRGQAADRARGRAAASCTSST